MSRTQRRVISFIMTLVVWVGVFAPYGSVVHAKGTTIGGSKPGGNKGQSSNSAGGGYHTHLNDLNFRVSVQRDPSMYNDGSKEKRDKILDNYSYRYPKDWDSAMYFIPNKCRSRSCSWDANFSKYHLGLYDPSSKRLLKYSNAEARSRMVAMNGQTSNPGNMYKSQLKQYSYTNSSKKPIADLADGKWKAIANSKSPDDALKVWSYILYTTSPGNNDVSNRLNTYVSAHASSVTPDSSDDIKDDVSLGYLDLLMCMWKVAHSRNSTALSYWERAIEDYIKVSQPEERPVAIVIDNVSNMKETATTTELLLIPTIDYFQFYTGIRSGQDIYNITNPSVVGSAKGDSESILKAIVNKAREDHPDSWFSNYSDMWSRSTWNWGASAIMKKGQRFVTYNKKKAHYSKSGAQQQLLESLYLGDTAKGRIYGFNIIGFQVNEMVPSAVDIGFNFMAKPDNEMLNYKSEIIGKQVTIDIQVSPVKDNIINAWKNVLKRNTSNEVVIKLHMRRDGKENAGKYTSAEGDWLKGVKLSNSAFIELLKGNKSIKLLDDVSAIPIKEEEKKVFTYEAKIEINYQDNGKPKQWVSPDFGSKDFTFKDTASFIRPEAPPEPMLYNNYPIQYAEIKEGVPDYEKFEAMAGVPSTERLYFGSGGTEFVIDVELEYEKNKDSVWRTYRSYFKGIECEHKEGDASPNKVVGGESLDIHNGGNASKTWSGSIPNLAQPVTALHNASTTAVPDMSDYNSALAEANAFASQVGGTVHTHTASSDGVTRSYSGWDVAVNPSSTLPTNTSASVSCSYRPATDTDPGTPCGHEMATANPSGPGSYTITVTWGVSAHKLCGPCCTHDLPQVNDTWKQRVNIDFLKINKVEVYRLTEGMLTPVNAIFGSGVDELRATSNNMPTLFYNIAQKSAGGDDVLAQSSRHGRLRYTLEPQMHDTVVWDEGERTNKCDGSGTNGVASAIGQGHANAQGIQYNNMGYPTNIDYHKTNANNYDKSRPEFAKFDERRNLKNNVTVISDVLILQTSSGDKSVIHFEKEGVEITTQEQFEPIDATKLEMWDANPNTSAKWSKNEIPIGSYNGNFSQTGYGSDNNRKYWGYNHDTKEFYTPQGLGQVETIFDNDPAQTIHRPQRPDKLYMYKDAPIVKTNQNKLYNTGKAYVFYERILDWVAPNPYDDPPYSNAGVQLRPLVYNAQPQSDFGGRVGLLGDANYSPNHVKINDIVIHTPVTTENAVVIGLDSDRDQRTETPPGGANSLIEAQNKLKVCPLTPETCEFRVLNCEFTHDKELVDIDFEDRLGSSLLNKVSGDNIDFRMSNGMKIEPKGGFGSGNVLHAKGTRFSMDLGDVGITYSKGLSYLIEMDFLLPSAPTNDGNMVLSFGGYGFLIPRNSMVGGFTTGTNGMETRVDSEIVGRPIRLGIQFSLGNIGDSKIFIDGVEQKNITKLKDSAITEDKIGNDLNIGSWGKSDNYGGQFYVDNLKITKVGGTLEHTNSCYSEVKVHGVIKQHVHEDSCYSKVSTGEYACNGLPLNSVGQGSVVTKKNWDFSSSLNGFVGGTTTISHNNNALVVNRTDGDMYFYSPNNLGLRGESDDYIEITLKNKSPNSSSRIYFDNGSGWSESSAMSFSATPNSTDYKTYKIKIGGNSEWSGHSINSLRFDLSNGNGSGTVEVKSIKIKSGNNGLPTEHKHTSSCPKVVGGTLICGFNTPFDTITDKNSHVHDANCGVYNGWSCYNKPLNATPVYTCGDLPLNSGFTPVNKDFVYTGNVQTFTVPASGVYTFEAWGAQGTSKNAQGGKGGYAKGSMVLQKGEVLKVYVGGTSGTSAGGWNGGGSTGGSAGGGGGATDIRRGGDALTNRIIVAGGGGGAQAGYGGDGGGLVGLDGEDKLGLPGKGGTQNSGGSGGGYSGTLGKGGNGDSGSDGYYGGAGGGGYYGGGGANSDHSLVDDSGGGGGSSYIGGLTDGYTQAGVNSGNGKLRITAPSSVPTTHTHNSSCKTEFTTHKHTSSCATVKEYSCGAQVKNAHTDVTDYTGGLRTYGSFENIGGKVLSSDGVKLANGEYRINEGQRIYGPGDEFYAGTYLVTLVGTQVKNANIVARDNSNKFVMHKLNTDSSGNVTFVMGVMEKTDTLEFEITSVSGTVSLLEVKVDPITIREPIGLCTVCKKHVPLKANGAKISCTECNAELYDFGEKINFMSSTSNNGIERQIVVLGAGGKSVILKTTNGYKVMKEFATPNNELENAFGFEYARSSGCTSTRELYCTEVHHNNAHYDGGNDICWDACGNDDNHKELKDEVVDPDSGETLPSGTFINLDYGFRVYYPNKGNFAQHTTLKGIPAPTSTRGQGYIDYMDTTKYTEQKRVRFGFNVIHKGVLYLAGEWIDLKVDEEYFDFYCVLANEEALGAKVEWEAVAINGRPIGDPSNDNYDSVSNRVRYSDLTALHGAYKQTWIDVVGRIGNYTNSDTDDFRFSNLFKEVDPNGGWLIEGILPSVKQSVQNNHYGDVVDIRGEKVNEDTNFLNTYGTQDWLEDKEPTPAPINPKDNPVVQLREKFMRVGYDIYNDISTIGNYQQGTLRVLPYYYLLDIDTNTVKPLDVYMKENDTYKLINKYRGGEGIELPDDLYQQDMVIDWEKESARRNYTLDENHITDRLSDLYKEEIIGTTVDDSGNTLQGVTGYKDMARPRGNYIYQGNTQRTVITSSSKTYIGSSRTYGEEMNIGGLLEDWRWAEKAQKWHMKFGLPSSAIFVLNGKEPTQDNIDEVLNTNGVVINALDVIAMGETYTLRWQQPGISSFKIELNNTTKTFNIENLGLPPIIALYEAGKTSIDDITINGTH